MSYQDVNFKMNIRNKFIKVKNSKDISLLVIIVLVVIPHHYGPVHWICPPDKHRTLDELLTN